MNRFQRGVPFLVAAGIFLRIVVFIFSTHHNGEPDAQPSGPYGWIVAATPTSQSSGVITPALSETGEVSDLTGGPTHFGPLNGITVDAQGDVYVVEGASLSRVIKLSPRGQLLGRWGDNGYDPGQYDNPAGIAVSRDGRVYIADTGNNHIQVLSPGGKALRSWGTTGTEPVQFIQPVALAVDAHGKVFTVEGDGHRVQAFSGTGRPLLQWGRDGQGKAPGPGLFDQLTSIAVDAQDHVYVADEASSIIQEYSATGTFIAQWGSYPDDPGGGYVDMTYPSGVAVDSQGKIFVVDSLHGHILKLSHQGKVLATWRIPAATSPGGITLDAHGNVYVTANTGQAGERGVIYKLSPRGKMLSVWG